MDTRTCGAPACRESLADRRADAEYCSPACRVAAHRARRTRRAEIDSMFRAEITNLLGVSDVDAARVLANIDRRIAARAA